MGLKAPENPPGVVPIFEPDYPGLSHFFADSTLLDSRFSQFRRTVKLDSTQKIIQIREQLYGKDYKLPVDMSLDYYVKKKLNYDNLNLRRKTALKNLSAQQATSSSGIELNIPVRIRSKAFQRIFGGDRVGLRVTGNISFELAGRSESREGSAVSSYEQRGNFSPRFKQTQQFQVEGRVGDKVSVKVDQNSEATFDFENTLRLTYTGDEDEIVQKIEAGNVSLSLPSTNYVSTSSKHQGLFGLKTEMKLGNLSFVGIASLQRGEKQKITKTGNAAENTYPIKDYDYVNNRFFFVDDIYRENFESGYNTQTMAWQVFGGGAYKITQLDVWVNAQATDQETREAWAVLDPSTINPDTLDRLKEVPGSKESAYFKRLEPGKDYGYDEYRGFFWLNQTVNEGDIVAVSYSTEGGVKKGMLFNEITDSSSTLLLKLVKPQTSNPSAPTWDLTMRNVYNLGGSQISPDGFDVKIVYTKTGENLDVQPVGDRQPFIYLTGLDRLDEQGSVVVGGDKQVDVKNGNIFDLGNGYLIFPSTTPFAPPPNSPFAIDTSLDVKIYNIKDRSEELRRHKFDIVVTTSSVSSNYNLGFNVLEGSEVVKLNGRVLQKDKDYTIDYFGGTLQILADEARRADANVEIEYERGSLFQLDKKTLLGGRLEYSFGDRGFIGLTGLYLNKTTLDQRVRLGQEPVRNFIWDVNTALDFKPNFITKALDHLPILETSAESRLHIEGEYAQVNPNPNTFNEDKLGEKNGVAYIDDFEGSQRTTPLGIIYRGWAPASVPVHFRIPRLGIDRLINLNNDEEMYQMDSSRVRMFWYNPYDQVPIKDIWPNKDVNSQTGTTTNVLVMQWNNENISDSLAWAGVMRSTFSFPDQKKTKFIELWVKGSVGQINVDMGRISEDFYIKRNTFTRSIISEPQPSLRHLNTEDFNLNGLLDDGEDVGLDGVPYGDPNNYYDPWDVWKAPQETNPYFLHINGTEKNGDAKGAKYPDTEDLDGNGRLDMANDYFTYSFDLADSSSPYIKGSTQKGWRLYRIPIRSYDPTLVVGNPDTSFQEIFNVRLWINNLPEDSKPHAIQIATFDLVGNEWEEAGVAQKGSSTFVQDDSLFSIEVYNTEENADKYTPPPGVEGVVDRITRARSKEQSLVLTVGKLLPGERAEANKQLYEKLNLINYKKLKMFVHGDPKLPLQDPPLEFYIRFGPTESIYYEVGRRVLPNWDEQNFIDVVLDELAKTKQEEFFAGDSMNGQRVYYREDPDRPGGYLKAVGNPNLRNINYITIGVRNISQFPVENTEIWLDELRVTDVERQKGTAMRLMTDLTMADVATFRAQWEVQDADFRRIEDQFGSGSTTEKQSYRMALKLNKFFPTSWGLQMPVSGGYVRSRNVPKYFYNTDQLTNYRANGAGEKLQQFFGMSKLDPELEKNSRISETTSLGATIQRQSSPRTPWYLKYSVDMLTLDVDWAKKHASDEQNLFNDNKSISGQLQVRVPFGRENSFQPFGWLGNGPIVRTLANQKVYYTPSSLDFSLGIRDNENSQQSRLQDQASSRINTGATRKMNLAYSLFPSLSFNFSRDYQSDAYLKGYRAKELVEAIFTKFDFGVDKVMNQNFSARYNPKWFSWMTQSFTYTAGFNYNFGNVNTNERSSRLAVSKQLSVSMQPTQLANQIYNPAKRRLQQEAPGGQTQPRRGGPRRLPDSNQNTEEDTGDNIPGIPQGQIRDQQTEQAGPDSLQQQTGEPQAKDRKKEKEPKKKGTPIKVPNPAMLVWKFFNAWKSINLDYRITNNYGYYNIDGIPTFKHQLGLSADPGVGTDTTFNKLPRLPALNNGKSVAAGMNFDIIKNLTSTFKYNYTKDVSQNNQQKTENVASTYFFMGDDPDANKKPWSALIPDWQFRLTGVEKLFFFSKFAQTIQVEHQRTGKFNESNRYDGGLKQRLAWGYANNYSPLLGITINTIWGISGNIRYIKSTIYNYNATGADTKSLSSGMDMTVSFSKTGGFRIPLPFLKNKKLKNEMQFNLNVNSSQNVSFAKRPSSGSSKFIELDNSTSLKFKPSVTYRFSQKVNGSMFFEYSSSKNKKTGKYSYFEFGVNVNIAIR
ncbi:MAG: cell surface protein SprA [Calditrichia bacterium]